MQAHGIKMLNLIDDIKRLEVELHSDLQHDVILQSVPYSFSQLVLNYHMNHISVATQELVHKISTAFIDIRRD